MLRTAQSLPLEGLLTLHFDAGRFPPAPAACYRAPWRLPGPDSHRLATTSFHRLRSHHHRRDPLRSLGVLPGLVELEVAVPRLKPASR